MSRIVDSANLYCKAGSKDAVYQIQIVEIDGGFVVNYQNGRAGGTLASGTKSPKGPGPLELARKVFDKVVREKMTASPPYLHASGSGAAFAAVSVQMAARSTGLSPQLLKDVDTSSPGAVEALLRDDRYGAQQKHDGERRMARVQPEKGAPIGSNRKGLEVALPQAICDSLPPVECVIDAEIIGDYLYAFDLLELNGVDLRARPYRTRKRELNKLGAQFGPHVQVVADALCEEEKRSLLSRTLELGQEGVVFKDLDAPYSDTPWKLKHWNDATVVVLGAKPDRRSVAIGLFEDNTSVRLIEVGSVTIPPNKPIPAAHTLIDVKYLYAYEGGSLFQPTLKGPRTDLEMAAARLGQLKFKADHVSVACA